MGEGVSYGKVELQVILPEGAKNVKFETEVPLVRVEETVHRTFMDTVGRTTLKLTSMNVADETRDKPLIVRQSTAIIMRLFANLWHRSPMIILSVPHSGNL